MTYFYSFLQRRFYTAVEDHRYRKPSMIRLVSQNRVGRYSIKGNKEGE